MGSLTVRHAMVAVLLAVLTARSTAQSTATTQGRESILAAEHALSDDSFSRGMRTALGAKLATDAVLLYPGAPVVRGDSAVRALLTAQPMLDSIAVRWHPLSVVLSADSRLAVAYGIVPIVRRGISNSPINIGNYAHVWRWIDGTGWRLAAALHVGVTPPASNQLPASVRQNTLPPLQALGDAKRFVDADLAFARLAASNGPATAFRTYAADDAVLFTGASQMRRGKDEIAAAFTASPPPDWTWHPVVAGASADGSLGFTVGESTRRPRSDVTAAPDLSKYLSVWRVERDGSVRFLFDGGNARPPQIGRQ